MEHIVDSSRWKSSAADYNNNALADAILRCLQSL